MDEPREIRRYLSEVDAYLHIDRRQRRRVLEEIEGHLEDVVASLVATGVGSRAAVTQAIGALGAPATVAAQFAPDASPARSIRGWRRWAPVVLPVISFALTLAGLVWTTTSIVSSGLTRGAQIALEIYLVLAALTGALVIGALAAIRRADRDPSWRVAAWCCTGATVMAVLLR